MTTENVYLIRDPNKIRGAYDNSTRALLSACQIIWESGLSNLIISEYVLNSNIHIADYTFNHLRGTFISSETGLMLIEKPNKNCVNYLNKLQSLPKGISHESPVLNQKIVQTPLFSPEFKKSMIKTPSVMNDVNKSLGTQNIPPVPKINQKDTNINTPNNDAKLQLQQRLEELNKKSKQIKKDIKTGKEILDANYNETASKQEEISDLKYKLERQKKKDEEELRVFDANRKVYFKIKKELRENKYEEEEIPDKIPGFAKFYPVYKSLDDEGVIKNEDAYSYYVNKIQEIKYEEYLDDKDMYYQYKKALKKKELDRTDIDGQFRQRFEVFDSIDSAGKLFKKSTSDIKVEYDLFIDIMKEFAKRSRKAMYQPPNIEYIKDTLRPTIEIVRQKKPETSKQKNKQKKSDNSESEEIPPVKNNKPRKSNNKKTLFDSSNNRNSGQTPSINSSFNTSKGSYADLFDGFAEDI